MARTKFVKLKVTQDERDRWAEAAEAKGRPLGAIIREYLDDLAARVAKERNK